MTWSDVRFAIVAAFIVALIIFSFVASNMAADRCEARGGVWVSHPAECRSAGSVIDIDG